MNAAETTVIAHRGFAGRYPENTLRAAASASGGGPFEPADAVEVDARPCGDGRVVAFHDERLSARDGRGLTDATGLVRETPSEVVRAAEVLGSGETVPTLEAVMDAVPPSVGVNVELKHPGPADGGAGDAPDGRAGRWRPFAASVLDAVAGRDNDVLVSSFHEAALARVRELDPDVPAAFIFGDDLAAGLDVTRRHDCEAMHVPLRAVAEAPARDDARGAAGSGADVDLAAVAREEDRALNAWTVRTWYEAARLADAGVDGIIADYPGLLDAV